MEPYQYWTIAGFIFIFAELITLRTLPLVLAGALLFAAVIESGVSFNSICLAFKYPENIPAQIITFFVFMPVLFFAIKPYIKNKLKGRSSNEHK